MGLAPIIPDDILYHDKLAKVSFGWEFSRLPTQSGESDLLIFTAPYSFHATKLNWRALKLKTPDL